MASTTMVATGMLSSTNTWNNGVPAQTGDSVVCTFAGTLTVDRSTTFSGVNIGDAVTWQIAGGTTTEPAYVRLVTPKSLAGTGTLTLIGSPRNLEWVSGTQAAGTYKTKGLS